MHATAHTSGLGVPVMTVVAFFCFMAWMLAR